ncbi:toxin-antitoxin system YwqK family antitoxin [Flavobacterium sp. 7A]|uniref:toxin-antitoxin system YwqK family antitoxin n=1 Tax=Flavobacterium sp. 7A TaxID=2940571 RepID=UPI002227E7AF|nr:membrane-binding protein [Flavobacterium sp. 7A]MCW2120989.1 antitoxin component YwqK of YwqJK toxin-antitoxin module [Flavobacterium sp. 7A]
MKKYIILGAMLISGMLFANEGKPKLEVIKDNMVLATYYYDNGQVQQKGAFKDGKLQGEWVSYDENGKKIAIAEYNNGEKVGKWFHWSQGMLNEVDYSNNRVVAVKSWKKDALVNN